VDARASVEVKRKTQLQTITGIKPLPPSLCVSLPTELTQFILYKHTCWNNKPSNGQVILAHRGQKLLMEDSASSSRAWMARSCLPSWSTDINVFHSDSSRCIPLNQTEIKYYKHNTLISDIQCYMFRLNESSSGITSQKLNFCKLIV